MSVAAMVERGSDVRQAVEAFLQGRPRPVAIAAWEPLAGGRSADTVRLGLTGEDAPADAVLHVQPEAGPHAGITTARRQFELLRALEETEVPAPAALWLHDAEGPPRLMITEFVAGDVPNPWRPEGQAYLRAERAERPGVLADEFVRVLAAIHAVDPRALPASAHPAADEPSSPALRELARWTPGMRRSSRFADDPVLTYAREWLIANEPAPCAPALVHGDYRIGNLVLAGGRIAAVLDWELARVGDPLLDVATVCAPPLRWGGLASGLWEPGEFVERYAQVSGRAVEPGALEYYTTLATFKIAGVWVNAAERFASGERDLASLRAGYSLLQTRGMLAETLGLRPARDTITRYPPSALDEAFETLRAALRDDVLPSVADAAARETLIAVRSVLRAMADEPPRDVTERFARDAAEVLSALRATHPDVGDDLASAIRTLFGRLGRGAGTDPALAPLRDLVGRAAGLSLGRWP